MDPLSQGVLGASLPQAVAKSKELRWAAGLGFLAGLLPDIDVLIQSSEDSLLFLEYHRQFTHSLIFIPIGGLIVAGALYAVYKGKLSFKKAYLYSTLGYATHGVLDTCTTYGTQLFWPFSNMRLAWNFISIIDPLLTFPLLFFVIASVLRRSWTPARWGLLWFFLYMGLGALQHRRAVNVAHELAAERGHATLRVDAKPSFGNIVLWKLVYETEDRFYVDAVRVLFEPKLFPGESIQKFDLKRDFPTLDPDSRQARDIERFRWFSNNYIAVDPVRPNVIGDVRYSMIPNQINPLWGIVVDPTKPDTHVRFENFRDLKSRAQFFEMLGF